MKNGKQTLQVLVIHFLKEIFESHHFFGHYTLGNFIKFFFSVLLTLDGKESSSQIVYLQDFSKNPYVFDKVCLSCFSVFKYF